MTGAEGADQEVKRVLDSTDPGASAGIPTDELDRADVVGARKSAMGGLGTERGEGGVPWDAQDEHQPGAPWDRVADAARMTPPQDLEFDDDGNTGRDKQRSR